ncbi:MAG: hypothetical protein ACE5H8_02180 [Alphaproteobacteria bacterium]
MKRRVDWPERLARTVRAAQGRRFAWGGHDCALFVCDCILAMTGCDPAARFRGRYRTARGAARALRRIAGVATLDALATRLLGAPVPVATAKRGDIVLLDTDDGPALGVVIGARAAFTSPRGLAFVPVSAPRRAWRV